MTHLDRLDMWLADRISNLERLGALTYSRSHAERPNPSAQLIFSTKSEEVELLLWESGEAEFSYGPLDKPRFEHHEVESPEELADLLERFLVAVAGGLP